MLSTRALAHTLENEQRVRKQLEVKKHAAIVMNKPNWT